MAVKQKLITTAEKRPKLNQKTPVKQYRWRAGAKGTELRDLIRVNKIYELRLHRRSATLSKGEARVLVGRKINKDNSCTSVSQKCKQPHAVKFGRHYRRLKLLYKCYKIQKTEVSHTDKTPVKPHLLRYIKIKLLGHGILPNRAPSKTKVNRLLNQDKVRQNRITDHLKVDIKRK